MDQDQEKPARYRLMGDWTDQRELHRRLGQVKPDGSVDQEQWKLVEQALKVWGEMTQAVCAHCQQVIDEPVIRCLDCKMPMHERCAVQHFWPQGRPKAGVFTAEQRLRWLHQLGQGNPDSEGFEWGIYRVKWANGEQKMECWQTNGDSSDLDAAMRAGGVVPQVNNSGHG